MMLKFLERSLEAGSARHRWPERPVCSHRVRYASQKVYGVLPQWVDDCLLAVERHFVDLRAS
jgi:hypothetical protein